MGKDTPGEKNERMSGCEKTGGPVEQETACNLGALNVQKTKGRKKFVAKRC